MDELSEVQRCMRFIGWTGDPDRGFSHKVGGNGEVIARAHDEIWQVDYQTETERVLRLSEARRRCAPREPT